MSENKHTKGPWTVGCSMDERTSLTRGEYVVFPLPEDDEIEANARLIAAAPDLLHALKWAAEYVSLYTADGAGWTGVMQVCFGGVPGAMLGKDRSTLVDPDTGDIDPERLRAFLAETIAHAEGESDEG